MKCVGSTAETERWPPQASTAPGLIAINRALEAPGGKISRFGARGQLWPGVGICVQPRAIYALPPGASVTSRTGRLKLKKPPGPQRRTVGRGRRDPSSRWEERRVGKE